MASDIAISVESLSKCYFLGHNNKVDPNATLRDQIVRNLHGLARKTRDMARGRQIVQGDTVEEFWALRDVSFEIPRGARVGILGRNGAGKSTLLKLLSRITEPTNGRIRINGRVASLLEVGTGFHPELTGRENIFLNGAILGMSRREIQSKFDEIVEFAEVERFLDTPVKRYSSGMYVRLAFAVAAHLEPEILVVDEVLAVGDVQFQKKCLGKMDDVAKSGRTILFVSHNMAAIGQLCNTAIMLNRGEKIFEGKTELAIALNLRGSEQACNPADFKSREQRKGDGSVRFEMVSLMQRDRQLATHYSLGEDLIIRLQLMSEHPRKNVQVAIEIVASNGLQVCHVLAADSNFSLDTGQGPIEVEICVADMRLYPDRYQIQLWAGSPDGRDTFDKVEHGLYFDVVDGGQLTSRSLPRSRGVVFLTPTWAVVDRATA